MITTDQLSVNIATVKSKIVNSTYQSGRDAKAVTLMAVTKTIEESVIAHAASEGITHFGENRVQEAGPKVAALPQLHWECIGSLQRNKVRGALALFERIQSVDSLELVRVINRVAGEQEQIVPILLQVNVAHEVTKHGFTLESAISAAREVMLMPNVRGEGLMTIAPAAKDSESVRPVFATLRTLRDRLQQEIDPQWQELSMGMSDDFEVAISEGATVVRLGRALFGAR